MYFAVSIIALETVDFVVDCGIHKTIFAWMPDHEYNPVKHLTCSMDS